MERSSESKRCGIRRMRRMRDWAGARKLFVFFEKPSCKPSCVLDIGSELNLRYGLERNIVIDFCRRYHPDEFFYFPCLVRRERMHGLEVNLRLPRPALPAGRHPAPSGGVQPRAVESEAIRLAGERKEGKLRRMRRAWDGRETLKGCRKRTIRGKERDSSLYRPTTPPQSDTRPSV